MISTSDAVVDENLALHAKRTVNFFITIFMLAMIAISIATFMWVRVRDLEARTMSLERDHRILTLICHDVLHDGQASVAVQKILERGATAGEALILDRFYRAYHDGCREEKY